MLGARRREKHPITCSNPFRNSESMALNTVPRVRNNHSKLRRKHGRDTLKEHTRYTPTGKRPVRPPNAAGSFPLFQPFNSIRRPPSGWPRVYKSQGGKHGKNILQQREHNTWHVALISRVVRVQCITGGPEARYGELLKHILCSLSYRSSGTRHFFKFHIAVGRNRRAGDDRHVDGGGEL